MIKKILRKPYRKALTKLVEAAIKKHKPVIIVVMGDGQTSVGREIIYNILKTKFPVRRNIESPEAEFSVPLTVLGYLKYPKNFVRWLVVTTRFYFSIKTKPPYKHFLVLELNFTDPEILSHWLKVLKPETALIVGKVPIDYSEFNIKKVVKISSTHPEDILKPFYIATIQIGRYYRLDKNNVNEAIENFTLPSSKIRLYPGKDGSTIIDATHFQLPINLDSALELADAAGESGEKYIFTDLPNDIKSLKGSDWKINPKNYQPNQNDIIILRGNRKTISDKYSYLFESQIPLI